MKNTTAKQSHYLSARDIASRFGVSLRTVFRWKEEGIIVGHRIGGGRLVRYRLEEVEESLLGNKSQQEER